MTILSDLVFENSGLLDTSAAALPGPSNRLVLCLFTVEFDCSVIFVAIIPLVSMVVGGSNTNSDVETLRQPIYLSHQHR